LWCVCAHEMERARVTQRTREGEWGGKRHRYVREYVCVCMNAGLSTLGGIYVAARSSNHIPPGVRAREREREREHKRTRE